MNASELLKQLGLLTMALTMGIGIAVGPTVDAQAQSTDEKAREAAGGKENGSTGENAAARS